jgi:hypothetical protein
VKEVAKGYDCGIQRRHNDIEERDVIEALPRSSYQKRN